ILGDRAHHVLGGPPLHLRLDFKSDFHRRSNQPGEMRDHLVGDTPRVAPDTRGIETNAAVEPLGPAHLILGRGSACTAGRNRFDRSPDNTASRLSEPTWARRRLGAVLLE